MTRSEKWLHSMFLSKTSQKLQSESNLVFYHIIMSHMFRFGLLCGYSVMVKRGLRSPSLVGQSE